MHHSSTVNIILATYNGSKHIRRQLDSLLDQSYPNITIYIRDDGSTDGTVRIVEEYGAGREEPWLPRIFLPDPERVRGSRLLCLLTKMIFGIQIK